MARDARSSALKVGDRFREYGMDDIHVVAERDDWGDRVLIKTQDGIELSFDTDEVIEIDPDPEDDQEN